MLNNPNAQPTTPKYLAPLVARRAAVLELLQGDLEPQVEHFECVDHPDRLNRPDRWVAGSNWTQLQSNHGIMTVEVWRYSFYE